MSTVGKWVVSDNEEVWSSSEEFDTEAEAVEYALDTFAYENNLEPGRWVWVGQISHEETNAAALAGHAFCAVDGVERINERLYDLLGEAFDTAARGGIRATAAQEDELDAGVASVVAAWLEKHDLVPSCYTLGRVSSHVVVRDFEAEEEALREAEDRADGASL